MFSSATNFENIVMKPFAIYRSVAQNAISLMFLAIDGRSDLSNLVTFSQYLNYFHPGVTLRPVKM